jgi:2-polyprenyl-3-methyl-5-hydroxy-6-metoxy-1,4-benzoquinol methylase
METLSHCPICNSSTFTQYLSCEDYTVSHETFNIVKCGGCGFLFTNPRPKQDEIGKYYQSEDYISHSGTKKGLINSIYHRVRNYTIKNKFKIIQQYVSKDVSLLDIGCGTGEFLNYCNLQGWKTVGIEPSDTGRAAGIRNYGLSIFLEQHLQVFQPNSVDVITMWHVLEHVHELKSRIQQIKSLLKPGGYAFIAVPNHLSYDAASYNRFWAAYDVPRHLYHFDIQTITKLFEQEKMTFIKALPMKMDAFYVSMLSEKYKTGKMNYPAAVMTGLKSNMKAGGKAEGYSSVIYIFKK